jgi:hypothetical protein
VPSLGPSDSGERSRSILHFMHKNKIKGKNIYFKELFKIVKKWK